LSVRADIQMPVPNWTSSILIEGDEAVQWKQGAYEVWVFHSPCQLRQGDMVARGNAGVVWVEQVPPGTEQLSKAIVYLEGSTEVTYGRDGQPHNVSGQSAQSVQGENWFGRMATKANVDVRASKSTGQPEKSGPRPAIYERAMRAWDSTGGVVQPAQFIQGQTAPEEILTPTIPPAMGNYKRVQVGPRSNTLIQIKSFPGAVPNQSVVVFSNGLRAVIDGIEAAQFGNLGRIVIETDRLVFWGPSLKTLSPSGSETDSQSDVPIELYLEGNVVFRQGDRLIYADRMYYNATYEYGVVLSAEVFTPVEDYDGIVRLKADVLQQLNSQFFKAYGAAITSSRLGVPSYWAQAGVVEFKDTQTPRANAMTGQLEFDPRTGEAAVAHDLLASSHNNFVYIGGLPVFYWPVLATNLRDPSFYLRSFSLKGDDVFGTQVLTEWDVYQLLKIRQPPDGTDLTFSADWLSERGIGLGATFDYDRFGVWNFPGPVTGWFDAWGIRDEGKDDLGGIYRGLQLETNDRGRVYWRHRQDLPQGYQFIAELGWISDRNFLEQYFEREWDEWKDELTRLELKHTWQDHELRLGASVRLNDFFTQTEWLPRLDHYMLGHSFLHDHLTWFAHSQVAYARLKVAEPPTDPIQVATWTPLPTDTAAEGLRAATRQEVDLPLQLGPFKLVAYGLGEVAYWGQTAADTEVTRFFGQTGLRASLPIWKGDPTVHNTLFNLNGLAHKVTLETDVFWSDADQDLGTLAYYDPLQDDSQEAFLRTIGPIDPRFDDRGFLYRSNVQGWVTSPTTEVVDDLRAAKVGIHQRWQTKRGMPGNQRVIDWIVFDVDGMLYPRKDEDNFGEALGQLEYDFRWHVGDRLTLLSDGYADTFDNGLRMISFGGAISRPERGQLYAGIVSIEGPISSNVLVASVTYRLSEKWIADGSATYDFSDTGDVGERFAVTRIGESALIRLGFYVDHGRDNVGAVVSVEPRFLPNRRIGRLADALIPPMGVEGFQ
jgi:hypothetical protein